MVTEIPSTDPVYDDPQAERPLSELLSELLGDVTSLFRQEMELAKAEVKQDVSRIAAAAREDLEGTRAEIAKVSAAAKDDLAEAKQITKPAGMLGGAAGAGLIALLLLSFALAWGLAEVVPAGVAFLIVGLLYAIVAGVLFSVGKKKLQQVNLAPDKTMSALKAVNLPERTRESLQQVTPVPEQTVETLKEDVQWAKNQMR
jgi:ElaB/YqjD/DUF883 family membrane-anchored ribosome-binding protein